MKGLAQEYQDRVQVQIENGGLRVKIQPPAKADSERTETSLVTKAGSSSEGNPESKGEARVESKPDASGSGKHELKADAKAEAKTPGKSDGTSDQLGLRKSVAVTASDTAKSGLGLRSTPVVPMRTVGILILFIGVFAGGAWWLRKRAGLAKWMTRISGKSTRVAAYKIEVISQHHLGPKKALSLVRVHDRMLVLGITDESITVLSEFDAEPMGEEKTASSEIKPALGVKNFAEQLARFESEQTSVSQAKPREEEIAPSFTAPKGRVAAQYRAQSQIRAKLEGMKSL
jgi:flagellar protein FliO/FliZ